MNYDISEVLATTGSKTTTAALLSALKVETEGLKAVWYPFPVACFVVPEHFGDEIELSCSELRTYGAEDCMADGLRVICQEFRDGNECTCNFGHEGAYQALAIMSDICTKKGKPGDIALLRDLAPVMAHHATCEMGQAQGRAIDQALDLFLPEIEAHIIKKQCPSGGCAAYRTFHVLVSKCTGCGKCIKACDDDAIMGKAKFVHVINQRKCTQCGACLKACPEKAIVTAGAKKPKTPPKPIPVRRKK
ncbi:MAG: 4Fe-4S binding protein [Coriobacteriales bacterium]|nr:4Fe-4S binding protein [Coriobacteriales bacterium]